MSPLEKLIAIEEVKTVKARYWRSMDRRLWDEYEKSFSEDCLFDCSMAHVVPAMGKMPTHDDAGVEKSYIFRGPKAIREFVEKLLEGVRSVHQGHIPEIDIVSPTQANAIFPFEDVLDFPAPVSPRHIHGYGHYHEQYRRVGDRWYISQMTIYRLRVTTTDGDLL